MVRLVELLEEIDADLLVAEVGRGCREDTPDSPLARSVITRVKLVGFDEVHQLEPTVVVVSNRLLLGEGPVAVGDV